MVACCIPVAAVEIKDSDLIAMGSSKIVIDGGEMAAFKGRFHSDTLAYRNNLYVGNCHKPTMTCWISIIDQIGPAQIAADTPLPYEIKKWTKDEILIDDGNDIPAFFCEKTTISINLKEKSVTWFIVPVNAHEKKCQDRADKAVTKMTLQDSLSLEKMRKGWQNR